MKTNQINGALIAVVLVLLVLFVFTEWALRRTNECMEQQQVFIEYLLHKTDSLLDANLALSEKYWDLQDSLMIVKSQY